MAEDISTLVLQVKSDGIKDSTDQLNALTDAATKAEGAAKKLGTQTAQNEAASRQASGSAKALAEAEDTATRAVGAATTAYQKKSVEQKRYIELWNQELKTYAQAQTEATKLNAAVDKQAASYDKMWNAAQRMNSEFDKASAAKAAADFDKMWNAAQRMNTQFDASVQAYGRMQSKANEMNAAWDANKNSVDKSTGAHGSNAAAIREVMVLMHELSQGSMKRFGSSVMVLANQMDVIPGTVALLQKGAYSTVAAYAAAGLGIGAVVVGIGALVVGMIQGAHQQKAFNDALLETGNYAGTTVDGLHNIATAAAGSHLSIGVAKDAVLALAQAGIFTSSQMTLLAASATAVEQAFGVSVEKTVGQFEELSRLAITNTARSTNVIAQHALTLDQHYNFLTTKQFEYIVQLEKEGKAIEAAQFVTETFAKVQKARADESLESLGYVAKAWHGIKNAISGAMDAIGQVGAKQTLTQQLAEMKANRKKLSQSFATDDAAANSPDIAAYDKAIKKLQDDVQAEKVASEKKGADTLKAAKEKNAENALNGLIAQNDKEFKKKQQLDQIDNDWQSSSQDYKLQNLKAYQIARQKIIDDSVIKVKGNDTRTTDRDGAVDELKKSNNAKLDEMDGYITLSKERAKKEDSDRWGELTSREVIYDAERKALKDTLDKELAIYDNFHGKTKEEKAVNSRKRTAAVGDYNGKLTSLDRTENKDKEDVAAAENEEMDKLEKKSAEHATAELKRIDDLVKAERIRIVGIGGLKSAKMDEQAASDLATAAELQAQYDLNQLGIELGQNTEGWSERKVAAAQKEQAALAKTIAGYKTLSGIHSDEAGKQRGVEDFQRTTKYLNTAIAAGKQFEKSLTQAFGNVGKAIGGMSTSFLQMMKDKNDAQAYYNSLSQEDQKSSEAQQQLQSAQTDATISGYANMAESAKGFFDTKSKGAIIADGIAKGLHVVELARNAEKMISNLAAGASAMFAQSGWGGFAGVAAMAAVMAAFGVSVAGSKNDGGKSAAQMQSEQGTGTVFGDIGTTNSDGTTTYKTKSDSISKSLETLKSNSNVAIPINQAMLASLQSIEASMSGLANLVVRTPGLTNGTNMGITTGTMQQGAEGVVGPVLNALDNTLGKVPVLHIIGVVLDKVSSLWGKTTQNIVDSGLQLSGKVSALESGQGYKQYASVDTTSSSWFGLSKSTSNSVQTQGLDAELSQQFGLIFSGLETTMKTAASALGKNSDQVGKAIENMVITTTQVSLKGLSGDDLTNAINSVISSTMDKIAETAFPAMDDFRQVGEGYAQTVIRVATGIETAQDALKKFGITAIDYSAIQNKQGDVAAEIARQSIAAVEGLNGIDDIIQNMTGSVSDLTSMYGSLIAIRKQLKGVGLGSNVSADLISGGGGVSQLGTALSTYKDKFFTDKEKAGIMLGDVTDDFKKLGYALPASKQALRDLITSIGTATPATAELTGQLLGLSGEYSDMVDSMTTANSTATDSLNTTIDGLKTFSDSLKSLRSSLLQGDLSTLTPTEKYLEAKQEYEDTVSKALSGDTTAQGKVSDEAQSFLDAARTVFASSSEYSNAFNEVQKDIDSMSTYTDAATSTAQQQLDALNAQVTSLNTLNDTATQIRTAIANPQIAPTTQTATVDTTALEAQIADLTKQLADSNVANQQQLSTLTAAVYDAQAQNAKTVSAAVNDSAASTVWATQMSQTLNKTR